MLDSTLLREALAATSIQLNSELHRDHVTVSQPLAQAVQSLLVERALHVVQALREGQTDPHAGSSGCAQREGGLVADLCREEARHTSGSTMVMGMRVIRTGQAKNTFGLRSSRHLHDMTYPFEQEPRQRHECGRDAVPRGVAHQDGHSSLLCCVCVHVQQ